MAVRQMAQPANQRKLEAADALGRLADEAGMSLVHLAIAFVINHPAVTLGAASSCSVSIVEQGAPLSSWEYPGTSRHRRTRPWVHHA
ncbi:hypothetical protein JQX13_26325 [Archangium violaceum]|uniref:hypothetical protein n=1 Tax=Archangium violaceum TaxID=83451 RepID=UPI00193B49F6|nr:hypothetical protein [Archangium violaceum]QRK13236.1 hypothetical protein JQX13_26325 [Archangium violaceum]